MSIQHPNTSISTATPRGHVVAQNVTLSKSHHSIFREVGRKELEAASVSLMCLGGFDGRTDLH
jgi:hypothetical protein